MRKERCDDGTPNGSTVDLLAAEPNADTEEEREEQLTGCGATPCCNPRSPVHRYAVLAFLCFLNFGSYFCYDSPSALQDHIQPDMGISTAKYAMLYAVYSWPNVFLSLVGGYLVDRWLGVRLGAFLFSLFILFGQVVFAAGGFLHSFTIMAIGRFVFGLGGENLTVCQNAYCVVWFMGRELNFAFGLLLSFSRIGSSVNMWINPRLYRSVRDFRGGLSDYTTLGWVLGFGVITCIFSLYMAIQLAWLDRRAQRILRRHSAMSGELVKLRDVVYLPLSLWLLCIICLGYYCAVLPFIGQANLFFQSKYDFISDTADECTSLVFIISAVASPLLGILIDRTGRNLTWMIVASILGVIALLLLTFTFITPFAVMVLYGISYSMFASAYWPSVAYVVPANMVGTAYGLVQSVQNLGLAVVNMAAGSIVDGSGYLIMLIFFTTSMCIGMIFIVMLLIVDVRRHGNILDMPAKQRNALLEAEQKRKEIAINVDAGAHMD